VARPRKRPTDTTVADTYDAVATPRAETSSANTWDWKHFTFHHQWPWQSRKSEPAGIVIAARVFDKVRGFAINDGAAESERLESNTSLQTQSIP
jgi:hypothetical protein